MTTTTVQPIMLTGDSLIAFVNEQLDRVNRQETTRTDMIKDAGYMYDNGKAMYVQFYTELMRAKGLPVITDKDVTEEEYDSLDDDTKGLYDVIDDRFGRKWDHETVMQFIDELKGLDVLDKSTFDEYFYGVYDSTREMAEEYYTQAGVMDDEHPLHSFIDWDDVWERNLRHDFDVIEFDYEYYFFTK